MIGRLVSETIVDSQTLLCAEKLPNQQPLVRDQPIVRNKSVVRDQPVKDKLLKAAEVAKKLDISKSMVYRLMRRGEISTFRMGKAVCVKPQDLEDFILRSKE
jgi:excisionase family DNA binding protein